MEDGACAGGSCGEYISERKEMDRDWSGGRGLERGQARRRQKGGVGGTLLNQADPLRLIFNQNWTASTPTATAVVPVTSHTKNRVSAPGQPSHFVSSHSEG